MSLSLVAVLLLLQTSPLPGAGAADAYLDADARETVRLARARRGVVDRSIAAYDALAKQRISIGIRALRRDRVLFRRELAARIHWRRGETSTVEVLGARQVVPIARPEPSVPDDLGDAAVGLAFHPADERLIDLIGEEEGQIRHPLAASAEADYRFRSGDTTRVRLADGREVRLLELQVIPRRADPFLLRGSLWLDAATHDAVRAVFRLAAPMNLERDLADGDGEEVPRLLRPIVAELRYVTIEYALWERRWWLPRLVALDLTADIGSLLSVPVVMEQTYGEYRVTGADASAPYPADAAEAVEDTTAAADSADGSRRVCRRGRCRRYVVEVPADSASLLGGEHPPPSIYADGAALVTGGEMRELAEVFGGRRAVPLPWRAPRLGFSYLEPRLVRYNRVEGLALAGRLDADFGALRADATAWLALAGPDASVELGLTRRGFVAEQRLALYRRLSPADPAPRPLGIGNSLSAALLGRDEGEYFRALGAEVSGAPLGGGPFRYDWRLFAERQRAAPKRTDASLPRLFGRDAGFRENIAAAAADQFGGEVALQVSRGADPLGPRWGGRLGAVAQAGTFDFVRPSASAFVGVPLPGRWVGAVEAAAGASLGEAPVQGLWYLGGPASVRGYGGSAAAGDAFWRARAEAASALPGARLVLFSDAGWAGDRAAVSLDPPLLSAGAGLGLLDGLVRLDLSRRLRGTRGWRLDLYLDGML